MSQINVIAEILRRDGKISNYYSIDKKLSYRLGARIFDLRKQGWKIRAVKGEDKNCTYFLESEPTTPPKVPEQYRKEIITNQPLFTRAQM